MAKRNGVPKPTECIKISKRCVEVIMNNKNHINSKKPYLKTLKTIASACQEYVKILSNKKSAALIKFILDNDIYKTEKEILLAAIELQYKQTLSYLNQGLEHDGKETVKDLLDIHGNLITK